MRDRRVAQSRRQCHRFSYKGRAEVETRAFAGEIPAARGLYWAAHDTARTACGGPKMKILIADDHPIVRHGLRQVLSFDPDLSVVGEACNGDQMLELARALEWDLAVMDFSMPGRSGLELLTDLRRQFPQRPVLVLSIHAEELHAAAVLKAGGAGYITKESAPQELTSAIRKVAQGGRYVSLQLGEILASGLASDSGHALHERLSDREYRVMWQLAAGRQINAIASEMNLSPSTVSTYRTRVLRKLRLRNNAELVHYAVRHRLIRLAPGRAVA